MRSEDFVAGSAGKGFEEIQEGQPGARCLEKPKICHDKHVSRNGIGSSIGTIDSPIKHDIIFTRTFGFARVCIGLDLTFMPPLHQIVVAL